jgi:holo-[acyl-carrier protein] synthase
MAGRQSPRRAQSPAAHLSAMVESLLCTPPIGNVVAVGVDIAEVSEVQRSIDLFGAHYLDRIFTPVEQAQSAESSDPTPHLAARFAAKEATIKVLSVSDAIPPWTSMELRREPSGGSTLHLTGAAARFALEKGIDNLVVSLSHEKDMAIAVVVALTNIERVPLQPRAGQQQIST